MRYKNTFTNIIKPMVAHTDLIIGVDYRDAIINYVYSRQNVHVDEKDRAATTQTQQPPPPSNRRHQHTASSLDLPKC